MANNQQQQKQDRHAQALMVTPVRLPYPKEAEQYQVDESQWRALVDAVWPNAQSVDGILLALSWCRWRKLDPIKRPCHIVPIWNSKMGRNVEGVWPSISEVRITAFRTGNYAGIDEAEWGPTVSKTFVGAPRTVRDGQTSRERREVSLTFPEWCRHVVYRIVQGQRYAFVGPKVYFLAAYGSVQDTELPNEKWQEPGYYMLEKCSEAASLRRAFPEEMGDMVTAEEMEGRRYETQMDMGGGVTVESPTQQTQQRPQRTDARFSDKPVQDVDGDGKVQGQAPTAAKPEPQKAQPRQAAPQAEARRQEPQRQAEGKAQAPKQEPPRQQGQPQQQASEDQRQPAGQAEDQGEQGDGEATSFLAYDEVGEVIEVFTIQEYTDALGKLMMAAKSEPDLIKLYDHNISTIEAQSEEAKRPIFRTYSERMNQLRNASKAAEPDKPQEDQGGPLKLALFDHTGNPYARNLLTAEFVNGLDTLFKKAQDQPRLEALYRFNAKTIQLLPDLTKTTVANMYDQRIKAIGASGAGPGPLV